MRHRAPLLFSVVAAFAYRSHTTLGEQPASPARDDPEGDEQQQRRVQQQRQRQSRKKTTVASRWSLGGSKGGSSSSSAASASYHDFTGDCPHFGCPLTPQDVHYNTEKVKKAFEDLRQVPRKKSRTDPGARLARELLETSCGNAAAVTLTLIGYKGGMLSEQVRAWLLAHPFLFLGLRSWK